MLQSVVYYYHIILKEIYVMKVKVVGFSAIRSGQYQGRDYSNRKLSYIIDDPDFSPKDYVGRKAEEVTIPSTIDMSRIKEGDTVKLEYNRWGKVQNLIKL